MGERVWLRGGEVNDGVLGEGYPADVLVDGGAIAAVLPRDPVAPEHPHPARERDEGASDDALVLDCSGLQVMPGFIDAHVHVDATVLDEGVQRAMSLQGVTTAVLGQDGLSFAPSPAGDHDACAYAERYFAAINGTHPGFSGGSVARLLASYEAASSVNAVYQVPHGTIRYAVMGGEAREANSREIAAMCELLGEGLAAGARGMSTGLEYAPACYAGRAELVALCEVLAEAGLPHSSHMRGYEDKAPTAFAELMDFARATGVATHVSHYHGPAEVLAAQVDAALAEGLDVSFDSYPYLCGASILALLALPTWLPLAEPERCAALLTEPDVVARLREERWAAMDDVWPRVTLSFVPSPEYGWCEGMGLSEAAAQLDVDPAECARRLLIATGLRVGCVFAQPPTNSDESVRALARHSAHMAGSDAIYLGSAPHPRGWGTFARYLARHVVELGDWTWGAAAHHLASRAAHRFALPDRGVLAVGKRADIAVIDPAAVADPATYAAPRQEARGVRHVLVGGRFTVCGGEFTGELAGSAVRDAHEGTRRASAHARVWESEDNEPARGE